MAYFTVLLGLGLVLYIVYRTYTLISKGKI